MGMEKKALFVATVGGFVTQFEMENVSLLQELGYEVHSAEIGRASCRGRVSAVV